MTSSPHEVGASGGATVTPLTAVPLSHPERTERKRRWLGADRVKVAAGLAFAGFAVVLSAVESLAVRGQADFGKYELGLTGEWVYTVAVALEAGALTFAGLALWAMVAGDRAPLARLMTVLTMMAAAGASWVGARAAHDAAVGAAYLALFSAIAAVMWHQIMHRIRRGDLRDSGAYQEVPPRPRFGLARWVIAFSETHSAWKIAVLRRITSAEEALAAVHAVEIPPLNLSPDVLTSLSNRDRLAVAFGALGAVDVPSALALLTDRGAPVDQSYAYQLIRQMGLKRDETPRRQDAKTSVEGAKS